MTETKRLLLIRHLNLNFNLEKLLIIFLSLTQHKGDCFFFQYSLCLSPDVCTNLNQALDFDEV